MKVKISLVKLFLFVAVLFSSESFALSTPKIFWDYGFGVESFCQQSAAGYIDKIPTTGQYDKALFQNWLTQSQSWSKEALSSAPLLQKAWDQSGVRYLAKAIEIVGIPFERNELTVSLVLCFNLNSMGTPLMVNIPYYLNGPSTAYRSNSTWVKKLTANNLNLPLPKSSFAEMTFHEILHLYVMQLLKVRPSRILDCKYKKENASVKAHLHVFAIEKEVFNELSRRYPNDPAVSQNVLETSQNFFKAASSIDYVRAWEIVNQDGSAPFLDELRSTSTLSSLCPWCTTTNWLSIEWVLRLIKPISVCQ